MISLVCLSQTGKRYFKNQLILKEIELNGGEANQAGENDGDDMLQRLLKQEGLQPGYGWNSGNQPSNEWE